MFLDPQGSHPHYGMLTPWLSRRMIQKSMQGAEVLPIFCLVTKVVGTKSLTFLWIQLVLVRCSSNEVHTSDIYLWEQKQSWILAFDLINCWPALSQLWNQDLSFSFLSPKHFSCFRVTPPLYQTNSSTHQSQAWMCVSQLCFLLQTLSLWEPSKQRFLTERGS